MQNKNIPALLKQAEKGINSYLDKAKELNLIDEPSYNKAKGNTFKNLEEWLTNPQIDELSPHAKQGICEAIEKEKWQDMVNTFRQSVRFGTGGIRGMMAFDKASIERMKELGIDTDILRGPNTINDIVILLTSAGVAKYGNDNNFTKVVVGYDSRVRGADFARIVAELFLAYGYTVYFFDAPCPYPEITFAIPHSSIKADVGVLISASHNDYRYNGYKLSCANGSQFDPDERDLMYKKYIQNMKPSDIKLLSFRDAPPEKLVFLGGEEPIEGFNYYGRESKINNIHREHREHVKTFLLNRELLSNQKTSKRPLKIAFCSYYGAGRIAVPKLLGDLGFVDTKTIHAQRLNELDGLFPAFQGTPGKERQPDPGDPRAAKIAISAFKQEYKNEFDKIDILIGTDPDADRCGVTIKVPKNQKKCYNNKDSYHLPADDMWTLVLWYRLHQEVEKFGKVKDAEKKFIALSHTTSDSITYLALKHNIGVVKSWVGFASLAAVTRDVWDGKSSEFKDLIEGRDSRHKDCHPFAYESYKMDNGKRSINMAAMEQSNGFSILGGKPLDSRSLGIDGHVRDKDGTLAAVLIAEIAAWAKESKLSLIELLDKYIYLDPQIGLFSTFYEPDPMDGEYPGIEGDRKKIDILRRTLGYYQLALTGDLTIGGQKVVSASIYRTGKYDEIYPPTHDFQFPDEGVRFYFDESRRSHATIRPSGTGNSLRFHIQLHTIPNARNLAAKKIELQKRGNNIMNSIRKMLRAPRN